MKLAVCLLTCDRANLTESTLQSFWKFNSKLDNCLLLHADDCSHSNDNKMVVLRNRFKTVYEAPVRAGAAHAMRAMWKIAVDKGATHILHLENDWRFVSKLPLTVQADCVRLFGAKKAQHGPRARTGQCIIGTNERIIWEPIPDLPGWEEGIAHWGGPPSITRADYLMEAAMRAEGPKIGKIALQLSRIHTKRPIKNIVWHIG